MRLTVGELIQKLSEFDANTPVVIGGVGFPCDMQVESTFLAQGMDYDVFLSDDDEELAHCHCGEVISLVPTNWLGVTAWGESLY